MRKRILTIAAGVAVAAVAAVTTGAAVTSSAPDPWRTKTPIHYDASRSIP